MKIKIVQGEKATRLIERYLTEAPNIDADGDGKLTDQDWEEVNDLNLDDLLTWDEWAAKQTQGVDNLFDIAYADMPEEVNVKGDIEEALDKMYKVCSQNKDKRDKYAARVIKYGSDVAKEKFTCPNLALLIEGDAGSGKTARTKSWCEENGCNLLVKMLSSMDETDLGGTPYAETVKDEDGSEYHVLTKLPATELDDLKRPNSILFLDEYNRGRKNVRNTALKLVNEHCIPDARVKGGMRYFNNLLFVVMCINPMTYSGVVDEFDPAEKNRVKHIQVESDPKVTRKFIWQNYLNEVREDLMDGNRDEAIRDYGRLLIGTTILDQPEFHFDDPDEIDNYHSKNQQFLTARSFESALAACDGTPEDFLKEFPAWCGGAIAKRGANKGECEQPAKIQMIKTCLGNYKDIENKMNDLMKQGTTNKDLKGKGFDVKDVPEDDDDDEPQIQKVQSLGSLARSATAAKRAKK